MKALGGHVVLHIKQTTLGSALIFGVLGTGIAGGTILAGRYVSCFKQVPYKAALINGGALSIATMVSMHLQDTDRGIIRGLCGGIVLATAINKMYVNQSVSILSYASLSTISVAGILLIIRNFL